MSLTVTTSGNRHGPFGARRVSCLLTRRLSAWQTIVIAGMMNYVLRNSGKILGLECPEPLANLYEPAYFRATWATTALDAGFWTAMTMKRGWLKHICSIIFTAYYLICAEQADEKVRAVRSVVTVEHLRNSWNKTQENPILKLITRLVRPHTMKYNPREIRIPRPQGSAYTEPVHGWLYYDGPVSALKRQTKLILNVPGGGFVAMNPRTHDDALMAWAAKTGIPILSLDYGKAPEQPYPYALHESFDVYRMIMESRGRCVGLFTDALPHVIVSGDSAGGNLAAGLTIMVIEAGLNHRPKASEMPKIPLPSGLVLIYPCLDVNIGNWMTDEQMALIRDKDSRRTNQRILRRKTSVYMRTAATPYASESEDSDSDLEQSQPFSLIQAPIGGLEAQQGTRPTFKTRVAVPSMLSYFADRLLTPEMMRAMIVLYIGPHARPNFATDYHLSPVLAPDYILARFPSTYFLTGERDPLVDDTCIMAGRLRQAKRNAFGRAAVDAGSIRVELAKGISHGFLQMSSLYSKTWEFIDMISGWYDELFRDADYRERERARLMSITKRRSQASSDGLPLLTQKNKEPNVVTNGHVNGESNGRKSPRHHKRTSTSGTTASEESDSALEMQIKPLTSSQLSNGKAEEATPSKLRSSNAVIAYRSPRRKARSLSKRKHSQTLDQDDRDDMSFAEARRSAVEYSASNGFSQASKVNGTMHAASSSKPHSDVAILSADEETSEPQLQPQSPLAREHPIKRGGIWERRMSQLSINLAADPPISPSSDEDHDAMSGT